MEDKVLFYADVPSRVVAYLIDGVIVAFLAFIVAIALSAVLGPAIHVSSVGIRVERGTFIANTAMAIFVSAVYFVASWVSTGRTLGQRLVAIQVTEEDDGKKLPLGRAIIRWILLSPPFAIGVAVAGVGSNSALSLEWVAAGWYVILLLTTWLSRTKQGLHDRAAGSILIKSARVVQWKRTTDSHVQ